MRRPALTGLLPAAFFLQLVAGAATAATPSDGTAPAAPASIPPGSPAPAAAGAPEWLAEDAAGVLRLRLAHADTPGPDEGVLAVDPNRRELSWQGAAGDAGCRQRLQVPFARVRAVREEAGGRVRVEVKEEPRERWVFVPLPHAARLSGEAAAAAASSVPAVTGNATGLVAAEEEADPVPAEVAADVRLAVERLRRSLGRPALPSVAVYEAMHGRPIEIGLAELLQAPGALAGRSVRVHGIVEAAGRRERGLVLVDGSARLRVMPEPEVALLVQTASVGWVGRDVSVTGVLRRAAGAAEDEVSFWEYEEPDQAGVPKDDARTVSLADLVLRPEALAGQLVRATGRFRGRNLFKDLPGPPPRAAWVIKAQRHAVWVTGRAPAGPGFRLDPLLERDTTRWVEVVGTVEPRGETVLLRARSVALAAPATFVWSGPRLGHDPRPDVVFTIPLANEDAPARGAPLLVQFSAYMDAATFEDRVRVRWGAGPRPDREAPRARFTYDDSRRVLVVDPGQPLARGGSVEVQLMPGITDVHAAPLEGPETAAKDEPARVLSWRVAGARSADEAP